MTRGMARNNISAKPVAGDAKNTATATPTVNADAHTTNVADDGHRHSAPLSLFSNVWSTTTAKGNDAIEASRLNASTLSLPLFRHRPTKSTSSRTSVSSQPVLVRAYTSSERSRPSSASRSPAMLAMPAGAHLPPIEAFSFDGILQAVEPEVHEAIDGIAEIYARSRLSLADEYGSHMPPQGEIVNPRSRYSGLATRTTGLERTLTTVAEASSSSERLAGESRAGSTAGSGKGKATAYGSLRGIISRGRSSSAGSVLAISPPTTSKRMMLSRNWTVGGDGYPAIILKSHSTPSHQLCFEAAAELPGDRSQLPITASPVVGVAALPESMRLSAWFLWRKASTPAASNSDRLNAEYALKSVLHGRSLPHADVG
ncbi:hypothetical protein BLS_006316 [Venturia inaequalis]|uniref:Uncharacterized protein n=1 Tax=Venturia inaequalis TaxID=5025 RepID=A0A8H3YRJ0_VENIN|nr:hypothetical protein BLS_006316 [Venturia inaequalis]KAE9984741.1 hypothetical protein EG328_008359 [Venturia inaequalis]KAE9992134.1 hypothetical protein EG327_009968 [Venturia inaequalis]RDI84893.1 hypothetical protein Vi05172_g4997 [Venturia inaequalis]